MRYFLINIDTDSDSYLNRLFQIYILKEVAYNSILKDKANRQLHYRFVLIPAYDYNRERDKDELDAYNQALNLHYDVSDNRTYAYNLSVGRFLKNGLRGEFDFETLCSTYRFRISLIQELDSDEFSVTYTDGSVRKDTGRAGWATVRVGEKDDNGILDIFSGNKCKPIEYSGSVEHGTNNVGELSGIKQATENLSDKLYQVIISDCDYGMKSLRDYIHNWRINGFKGSDKKPIKNLELFRNIDRNILQSQKIFLFQWTESHVGTPFNERCDVLAKIRSGVLKEE